MLPRASINESTYRVTDHAIAGQKDLEPTFLLDHVIYLAELDCFALVPRHSKM